MPMLRLSLLLLCAACVARAQVFPTLVKTESGYVQGYIEEFVTGSANVWRGVPYAAPAIPRLQPPQPRQAWAGVLNATVDPPACFQVCQENEFVCPKTMSEDCLMLNIFGPRVKMNNQLAPVMVFMHGGNFRDGFCGGLLYNGGYHANHTYTIMVSISYRLEAFGFLTSQNGQVAGNFGVMDQSMALKWVSKNIAFFGGDPNRVTLFGQSAGAVSTVVHMYYPPSAGLFQSAIALSEPYGIPIRNQADAYLLETQAANYCNCSSGDLACYQKMTAEDFLTATHQIYTDLKADPKFLEAFMPYTPTVGGPDLPVTPYEAFVKGLVRPMPYIQGNTRQEGNLFIYSAYNTSLPASYVNILLLVAFGAQYVQPVLNEYPVPANQSSDCRLYVSNVTTDSIFLCVNRNTTRYRALQADAGKTWLYVFDQPSSFGKIVWGKDNSECWDVSCHGSDLPYEWHPAGYQKYFNFTDGEERLSLAMVEYITNFAHSHDPNVENPFNTRKFKDVYGAPLLQWPNYDIATSQSMHFSANMYIDDFFLNQECNFWDTNVGYVFP